MLRILKHFRNAQPEADNLSNVEQKSASIPEKGNPEHVKQLPAWQSMSIRLMQRLNNADEAVPELHMPDQPAPSPQNKQRMKS